MTRALPTLRACSEPGSVIARNSFPPAFRAPADPQRTEPPSRRARAGVGRAASPPPCSAGCACDWGRGSTGTDLAGNRHTLTEVPAAVGSQRSPSLDCCPRGGPLEATSGLSKQTRRAPRTPLAQLPGGGQMQRQRPRPPPIPQAHRRRSL